MSSFDKKGGGLMNKSYSGKKAQGLSLNMIVVGAIGLVVLVVIITIFVGSMTKVQTSLNDVESCEGEGKSVKTAIGPTYRGKTVEDVSAILSSECTGDNAEIILAGRYLNDVDANIGEVCCVTWK